MYALGARVGRRVDVAHTPQPPNRRLGRPLRLRDGPLTATIKLLGTPATAAPIADPGRSLPMTAGRARREARACLWLERPVARSLIL
jgi:hypothetical protein